MQSLVSISDVGTVVAFAIEQQLCYGKVDWMTATATGIIGVVSRLTKEWLSAYMPQQLSSDQRNELTVFVLAALYARMTCPAKSALAAGFRAVQADLMGAYFISFLGMDDKRLLGMPSQGTPAPAPIGPMGPPTGMTDRINQTPDPGTEQTPGHATAPGSVLSTSEHEMEKGVKRMVAALKNKFTCVGRHEKYFDLY